MLPGMYTLAQQWMADVAVDRFPELRNASVDIDQWFSDPRVSLYLQVASCCLTPWSCSFVLTV